MLVHPNFDPVAISVGHLAIRWYGLMYVVGFVAVWLRGRKLVALGHDERVTQRCIDDLMFYGALGVILGGRLGYVLLYKPGHYLSHPVEIVAAWEGGMSFHGGLLGALVATLLVARRYKLEWLALTDFVAPLCPLGLAAGRLGNFINGELWGRTTAVPWGMVFAHGGPVARHPSQLYELALEGVILYAILWMFTAKKRPIGAASGLFLIGYGAFRFLAEFFREPDDFLGLLAFAMSMGQWLSVPMIFAGAALFALAYRHR